MRVLSLYVMGVNGVRPVWTFVILLVYPLTLCIT